MCQIRGGHFADKADRQEEQHPADDFRDPVFLLENAFRKEEEHEQNDREDVCGQTEKPEERAGDETSDLAHQADESEKHEKAQRKQQDPLNVPRDAVRGILPVGASAG